MPRPEGLGLSRVGWRFPIGNTFHGEGVILRYVQKSYDVSSERAIVEREW